MNRLIPLALLISLPALAADEIGTTHKIGIGLGGAVLSNGITAKLYLSPSTAVQGILGQYCYYGTCLTNSTSMNVDFLQEVGMLAEVENAGSLFWSVGAGAGMILVGTYQSTWISGVVELGWHFEKFPLEITTGWRPTWSLGNTYMSGMNFNGGSGAIRYFF
jgi:hypothetical protein